MLWVQEKNICCGFYLCIIVVMFCIFIPPYFYKYAVMQKLH